MCGRRTSLWALIYSLLHLESDLLNIDLCVRYLSGPCPVCWSSPNYLFHSNMLVGHNQYTDGPHLSEARPFVCVCVCVCACVCVCVCVPARPHQQVRPQPLKAHQCTDCERFSQQPPTLPPGHKASGKSCFLGRSIRAGRISGGLWRSRIKLRSQATVLTPPPMHTNK